MKYALIYMGIFAGLIALKIDSIFRGIFAFEIAFIFTCIIASIFTCIFAYTFNYTDRRVEWFHWLD